jgi:hypothetical protein
MHPYDLDGMTDFKAKATFSQRVSLESIGSELLISIWCSVLLLLIG